MLCTTSILDNRMDLKAEQENRLSLSTSELLSMSEEITKLLQTKDEKHEAREDYNETIADLEERVEMLTNKLNKCKERTQSELEYFNIVLDNRNEELEQMQKKQEEKDTELKEIKKAMRKQDIEVDQKNNLINRYQQEIENLKEELEKQTKKLNNLKADKGKHAKKSVEVEEKANRIVSFDDNITVNTFEVEDPTEGLNKEISKLRNENGKLKSKLDELKWQMKAKDIMISNGEDDTMQILENQTEEIETLQERVAELEDELKLKSDSPIQEDKNNNSNNRTDNIELQIWKEKVKDLELKLKEYENLMKNQRKVLPPVSPKPFKKQHLMLPAPHAVEESVELNFETVANETLNDDILPDDKQMKYMSMLEQLRDSFYLELKLTPGEIETNGKGKFESVLEDFQIVLGTLRLKLANALEVSVKENNKEIHRIQSLKRMNNSLKEEIQQKTENYGSTVKSLESTIDTLSKSMTIQQQLCDEKSEEAQEAEQNRAGFDNQVKELTLKMMVRDSEVERLKGILEELKRKPKNKKIGKKDKKKSRSLSNLLK